MNPRRFLWRWSTRLLRADLRQHAVIVGLVTLAVALSVGAVVGAYNMVRPPEGDYGTGQVSATLIGDPAPAVESLRTQGHPYGAIQTVKLQIEGSQEPIHLRVQDPTNVVTGPLLGLVDGAWPAGPREVAVTDGSPLAGVALGDTTSVGGTTVTVVGHVENPTRLDDEFVLATGLEPFGVDVQKTATVLLVDGPPADVTFPAGATGVQRSDRNENTDDRQQLAVVVNVLSAVGMTEVALLVGAGFAVLSRRRSRDYGLLAAAGGTPTQIRQVATAIGVVIGLAGSSAGAAIGLVTMRIVLPRMESTVGHRIDLAAPIWTVAPSVVLAVVTAGAAAWWPARGLSREPIMNMLASMRPRPSSVRGSTTVGAGVAGVGLVLLLTGALSLRAPLMVPGIVLTMGGVLLTSPALIRVIGRESRRLPLASRMAGRALARQQGRSAAVVAALTLALGIPVAIAVVTTSIDDHDRTKTTNLDDHTAIVWLPGAEQPEQVIPADLDASAGAATFASIRQLVPQASTAAITVAVDPASPPTQFTFERIGPALATQPVFGIRPAATGCLDVCEENTLGDRDDQGAEILLTFHEAWIATPELLEVLRGDAGQNRDGQQGSGGQAISRFDDSKLSTHRDQDGQRASDVRFDDSLPLNTSLAGTLVRPEMVTGNGWDTRTIGWILRTPEPLDAATRESMSELAGETLLAEFEQPPGSTAGIRWVGTAIGIIVSVGILVAAVSLLASESAGDLRLLETVGASPSTARRTAASSAAMLAGTGALLALPVGYLALIVLLANPRGNYRFALPILSLLSVGILVPLLAAGIGWLSGWRSTRRPTGRRRGVAALLAIGVTATSCGATPAAITPSPTPFDTAIGCDTGMDTSFGAWGERGVGASVAIVGGDRQCVGAYGIADFSTGRPNTVDTVFSIGSITKAVTAAAIFNLIDEGVLALDDTAGRHVPGLSDKVGALPIRDLLLHTSGLTGEHGVDHQPLTREEATAAISDLLLSFDPGSSYSYTNAGYTLLALIIESVTDHGYRAYLADNILLDRTGRPIGGFWDGEPAARGPRAFGYQFDGTVSAQRGDFAGPHWAMNGNGGIAMTAVEMAEWTWSLFNGKILSPGGTELLTSTTTLLGQGGRATELAGWSLLPTKTFGEPVYTTSGGGGSIGHEMNIGWLPESGRVVVIAENAADFNVPFFSSDIAPAVIAGTGVPTPPAIPTADPPVLADAAGRYQLGDSSLVLTERDGGLLVETEGFESVRAVLPVPASAADLVAFHEMHARAFLDGESIEGKRFLADIESQNGPLLNSVVLGTAFEGELATYVELTFDGSTHLLVAGFNLNGGTEFWSIDQWPVLWFVVQPDGGFEAYQHSEEQPRVSIHTVPGGIAIDGPDRIIEPERSR